MVAILGPAFLSGIGAPALVTSLATIAFTYVDAQIMANITKDEPTGDTDSFLGVPTGQQGPGSPTIWAIGRRIRVPCHLIFQSPKVRESVPSQKNGPGTVERQVFLDALISVNTRRTNKILQLIGNGKLLAWTERDIIRIETDGMTASWTSLAPFMQVTMTSTFEVPFTRTFSVGDIVKLSGFINSNPLVTQQINDTLMEVTAVSDHIGSTPSNIVLKFIRGQATALPLGGGTATGGTPQTPAAVIRVDSAISLYSYASVSGGGANIILQITNFFRWAQVFNSGDNVVIAGIGHGGLAGRVFKILTFAQTTILLRLISGPAFAHSGTFTDLGTDGNQAVILLDSSTKIASGFFAPDYDFVNSFYKGGEDQSPSPLVISAKGAGNASAYRGVSYIQVEQLNVTPFGGQIPYSLEVIAEVDEEMTIRTAIAEVLKRADYKAGEYNLDGIEDEPFLGMYIVGRQNAKAALQPLALINRFLTQERGRVLHFFDVKNADVIKLGPDDIGWVKSGDRQVDPIEWNTPVIESMPTSFGVKFQDPDLAYVAGYESFAVRNPSGIGHQKDDSVNLQNVVMRRRDARDLGANTIRLTWINSTTFQVTISAYNLDVLENDILEVTDKDSNVHIGRVLMRRIITDSYLVECLCTIEDTTDLPANTGGSPIPPEVLPPAIPPTAILVTAVLDIPAMSDSEIFEPGLKLLCTSVAGSGWSGAMVYESLDGTTWSVAEYITQRSELGETLTSLPQATSAAETLGTTTLTTESSYTLDIEMPYVGVGLSNATETEARNGKNWFVIRHSSGRFEIFAAKTITSLGGGQYRLSNFLRGIRGTWFTATTNGVFPVGSTIALLRTYRHRSYAGMTAPAIIYFKFVPTGGSLDAAETITVTPAWHNVLPLPPRVAIKTIGPGPNYDIKLETDNWTRRLFPLGYVGPYPLDDLPEGYRIRLYNSSNPAIIEFEDTLVGSSGSPTLRDKFTEFFSSDLIAAGYTPGAALSIRVDIQQFNQYGFSLSAKRLV